MTRHQNDTIGKVAGAVLTCVLIAVAIGATALLQSQDAIDEAIAQRQALACFEHARMCAAVEARK
jgi:hypothetical protein